MFLIADEERLERSTVALTGHCSAIELFIHEAPRCISRGSPVSLLSAPDILPCFIFVTLDDRELVKEFGEEITIKTDCRTVLPRKDDYPELNELRHSIFNAVKNTRAFELVRVQYEHLVESKSRKLY